MFAGDTRGTWRTCEHNELIIINFSKLQLNAELPSRNPFSLDHPKRMAKARE
jgi:hypothetical protein